MLLLKNRLFTLTVYISVFLLLYMCIFAVFVKTPEMLELPSFMILFAEVAFLFIWLGIFYLIYKKGKDLSRTAFSLIILLAAFVPRIIWIMFIGTAPVSDFYGYNNYAINASKGLYKLYGDVYPLFPFKFGYPLVLSVIYRIFGANIMVAKVFNVAISTGVAYLIYRLGALLFNERAGRIASLIFAFWPAQVMYNSVVASEHIFMLLFLLAIWFFVLAEYSLKDAKDYLLVIVSGFMLALTYLIRPVSIILLPIIIVCLFIFSEKDKPLKEKGFIASRIKTSVLVTASTIVTIAVVSLIVGNILGVRLWKSSSGFSFYIGTNYESSGMYFAKDEEIIEEFNYDVEEVHKQATKRAIERITSQPMNFLRLIEKKFIIQWANEDYGYYWSMYKLDDINNVSNFVLSHPRAFLGISQIYYIALLIFAVSGSIYIRRHQIYSTAMFFLLLFAFVGAHTLFEVQSRYHYPVIPFFILIAGYGVEQIIERFPKEKV
jgi:4-amino-4-deoxy-L-arabinose transferase-like glycosyltransferase